MTTDPFADAAREEARRYHWELRERGVPYSPPLDFGQHMAEWARTHLAAQEPTDAECITVLNAVTAPLGGKPEKIEWADAAIQRCREALMTARTARRDEEKR